MYWISGHAGLGLERRIKRVEGRQRNSERQSPDTFLVPVKLAAPCVEEMCLTEAFWFQLLVARITWCQARHKPVHDISARALLLREGLEGRLLADAVMCMPCPRMCSEFYETDAKKGT